MAVISTIPLHVPQTAAMASMVTPISIKQEALPNIVTVWTATLHVKHAVAQVLTTAHLATLAAT